MASSRNAFLSSRSHATIHYFLIPNIIAPSSLQDNLGLPLFLLSGCVCEIFSLISWSFFLITWSAYLSLTICLLIFTYSNKAYNSWLCRFIQILFSHIEPTLHFSIFLSKHCTAYSLFLLEVHVSHASVNTDLTRVSYEIFADLDSIWLFIFRSSPK